MQDMKTADQVAGHENDGPSKSQGVKMQDMKMTDQVARHQNAGHEIAGRENARHENTGRENAGDEDRRHETTLLCIYWVLVLSALI